MKTIIRLIATRFRAIVFFVWVYVIIDLLARGKYLTFLRPEFGIVLAVAGVLFAAMVFAEMTRDPDDGLQWFEFQRPLILMLPLLFLMHAQGATLDYYTFGKRFTGTAGMAVNVEPSRASGKPAAQVRRDDNTPSSLHPSGNDRLKFNRNWNEPQAQQAPVPDNQGAAVDAPTSPGAAGSDASNAPATGSGAAAGRQAGSDTDDDTDDGGAGVVEATTTQLYEAPRLYEGKTVAVIGMVDANEDVIRQFGDRARVLFRFMITCCAADAQPIAVIFQTRQPFSVQGQNVWFRVVGRYTLEKKDGRTIPVIRDATASTVPKPANEYLY